jgi:hypothetical protein
MCPITSSVEMGNAGLPTQLMKITTTTKKNHQSKYNIFPLLFQYNSITVFFSLTVQEFYLETSGNGDH